MILLQKASVLLVGFFICVGIAGCDKAPSDPRLMEAMQCLEDCSAHVPAPSWSPNSSQSDSLRDLTAVAPAVADLADSVSTWHGGVSSAQVLDAPLKYEVQYKGTTYKVFKTDGPGVFIAYDIEHKTAAALLRAGIQTQVAGTQAAMGVLIALTTVESASLNPTDELLPLKYPTTRRATELLVAMDGGLISMVVIAKPAPPPQPAQPPAPKAWYSVDSSYTSCYESHGPAEKIEDLSGGPVSPRTNDFRGPNGELSKVEVIMDDALQEHVWTYYRSKSECERMGLNATQNLADRYR